MISKKAEYAVNILVELAKHFNGNTYQSSKLVAAENNLPLNLVPQLVSRLQKKGIIESAKGPKGGIKLARKPDEITLREVIEIFDGPLGLTTCLRKNNYCPNEKTCSLRKIWQKAQAPMIDELDRNTINDLAAQQGLTDPI